MVVSNRLRQRIPEACAGCSADCALRGLQTSFNRVQRTLAAVHIMDCKCILD